MTRTAIEARLKRLGLDRYLMILFLTVLLAAYLPARGQFATILSTVTFFAVALLFLLYGAKLSMAATVAGLTDWKLQLGCLLCTYALFPALGFGLFSLSQAWFPAAIGIGFLYLGCLPSTVQSSIAFTSMAGGNVAGAICAASLSNIIGVVLCPLLLAVLLHASNGAGDPLAAIWKIAQQILLPFMLGQMLRLWLSGFLNRHRQATMLVDRGSILRSTSTTCRDPTVHSTEKHLTRSSANGYKWAAGCLTTAPSLQRTADGLGTQAGLTPVETIWRPVDRADVSPIDPIDLQMIRGSRGQAIDQAARKRAARNNQSLQAILQPTQRLAGFNAIASSPHPLLGSRKTLRPPGLGAERRENRERLRQNNQRGTASAPDHGRCGSLGGGVAGDRLADP